jgi:putative DNA primase/helicase
MTGLAELGIQLRNSRPGEHRAACPECAQTKHRSGDDALAVRVDLDGSLTWLCHRCGWRGALGADRHYEHRAPARPAAPGPDRRNALEAALRLWRTAHPITAACPVGRYLTSRSCPMPLAGADLRWLPDRRHPSGWCGPAMVGLITDALTGVPMSLHFTWIRPDGTGKAPIERPRLMAKGMAKQGGCVRLTPDSEVAAGLLLGEGIETTLSAQAGFAAAWSCLDAGNLEAFPIIDGIEAITIVADHDKVDPNTGRRRGIVAAEVCARRWAAADREARIWTAPAEGDDFNDFMRRAS